MKVNLRNFHTETPTQKEKKSLQLEKNFMKLIYHCMIYTWNSWLFKIFIEMMVIVKFHNFHTVSSLELQIHVLENYAMVRMSNHPSVTLMHSKIFYVFHSVEILTYSSTYCSDFTWNQCEQTLRESKTFLISRKIWLAKKNLIFHNV